MASPFSILITGPESSGKSTISKAISERLKGVLVNEFARTYLANFSHDYSKNDVEKIIQGQYTLENKALSTSQKIVVLDTGPIVLDIWYNVKYGQSPLFLKNWIQNSNYDLIFLCKPDFAWKYDPLREHPNQQNELFELYEKRLKELKWSYKILKGNEIDRLNCILEKIKAKPFPF